ncbi:fluoride efflux transporter CrcB [Flavobacteriaceae bacterium M23B6Z8]
MKSILLVFLGGGLGSALRFIIGKWLNPFYKIPLGTFTVNLVGSLIIGIILGYAAKGDSLSSSQNLLLATGFCGGFTTFSAFSYENSTFLKSGDITSFAVYTSLSIAGGLAAVLAGLWISKYL